MTNQSHETVPLSRIGPKIPVDRSLPFHESLVHMLWHAVERKPDSVAISNSEFATCVRGPDGLLYLLTAENAGALIRIEPAK